MMHVKAPPFISSLFLQLSSVSALLEMDEDSTRDNIHVCSLGTKLLWFWGGRYHMVWEDQRPKPSDSRVWISLVLSLSGLAAAGHWIPRNPGSANQLFKSGSMSEGKRKARDHFHRAKCMFWSLATRWVSSLSSPSLTSLPPPSPITWLKDTGQLLWDSAAQRKEARACPDTWVWVLRVWVWLLLVY